MLKYSTLIKIFVSFYFIDSMIKVVYIWLFMPCCLCLQMLWMTSSLNSKIDDHFKIEIEKYLNGSRSTPPVAITTKELELVKGACEIKRLDADLKIKSEQAARNAWLYPVGAGMMMFAVMNLGVGTKDAVINLGNIIKNFFNSFEKTFNSIEKSIGVMKNVFLSISTDFSHRRADR